MPGKGAQPKILHRAVVIMGCDGSGKSLLSRTLSKRGWSVTSFFHLHADPRSPAYRGESGRFRYSELEVRTGGERSRFFCECMRAWVESLVLPAHRKGMTIIDSYVYRYVAKEGIFNPVGREILDEMERQLPIPKNWIWLKVPYETGFDRKRESLHRSDFWPEEVSTLQGFTRMQRAVDEHVHDLIRPFEVSVTEVDGTMSPLDVSEAAETVCWAVARSEG